MGMYRTCPPNNASNFTEEEIPKPNIVIDLTTHINSSASVITVCNNPLIKDSQYNTCRAPCTWSEGMDSVQRTKDVIVGIFSIVSIVIGIFAILVRATDAKSYKIPNVIIMYAILAMIGFGVTLLLPVAVGKERFFCEYPFYKPLYGIDSGWCTIQGVFGHFFYLALHLYWMYYIMNGYLIIADDKQMEYRSRLHAAQFASGIFIPFGCLFICLLHPSLYHTRSTHAILCTPFNKDLFYFTYLLPHQLSLGCSVTFTMLIIRLLYQNQKNYDMSPEVGSNSRANSPAKEDKSIANKLPKHFMPFICYYLAISIMGMVVLTMDQSNSANYQYGLFQYFTCLKTCQSKLCTKFRDISASMEGILTLVKSVYYSLLVSSTILFIIPTKEFSNCYIIFKHRITCQEIETEDGTLANRAKANSSISNVDQNCSKNSQAEPRNSSTQVHIKASVMI
ncbi:uncharacterized protein TRIADDRAFT_54897 [Trichoplax adhaerens]|uniref:Frizzled/Smoothened 7TM domain-containing protein n=1 Tax=Trichoplax adhaerens TaxID=10228 RepID=B3RTA8_TRIAD|nr:predicted protein [Trichoplax adhaerens]EDV26660.1 predicted protein [Trichoplax adhaerens]|eukprot:XP_002110656.1 predicted protein [Trichoplax adhaerens]